MSVRHALVDDSFFCQSLAKSAKYRLVIKGLGQSFLTLPYGDSIALIPPNELVLLKLIEGIHGFANHIICALVPAIAHASPEAFFDIGGETGNS